MYVYVYVYICICVCVCTYIYIHIHFRANMVEIVVVKMYQNGGIVSMDASY